MTIGAWVVVIFACFLIVAAYCAWEERRDEKRRKRDHICAHQPGYSRDEQIADFPEAVERDLRRSS